MSCVAIGSSSTPVAQHIEKDIVAYIAYVEENGQLVPRVKFEN